MRKLIALITLLLALAGTLIPTPAAAAGAAGGPLPAYTVTAWVSEATPAPNQMETVGGRLLLAGHPVAGAALIVTWTTKAGTSTCTAVTGANGTAWCSHAIGNPAAGVVVPVSVVFVRDGQVRATTMTRFTPRVLQAVVLRAIYSATASVSDATPAPNRLETVGGRLLLAGHPVAGAAMVVTWTTKAGTSTCTAVSGANGTASCSRAIGQPAVGVPVRVTVVFVRSGQVRATTTTRFTPRESGRG